MRIYSFDCGPTVVEIIDSNHANAKSLIQSHLIEKKREDLVPLLEYRGNRPIPLKPGVAYVQALS